MISLLPLPRKQHIHAETNACARPHTLRVHPATAADARIAYRAQLLGIPLISDPTIPELTATSAGSDVAAKINAPAQAQGYALSIAADYVFITGNDAQGLLYGLTTLHQILDQTDGPIPAMTIEDWPQFTIRYHHDDISRKQISTLQDFKRILHHLATYKISHYTLYMEDVLHLKSHPQIGEGRGKLMPEEIREIVATAARLGIDVFPTFTLLGHHENLLSLPRYCPLATDTQAWPSTLDPRLPEVRALVADIINEICDLFPSPYFHMGFDETHGVGAEVFVKHANWCAELLVERGKTPVMWGDRIYGIKHGFGIDQIDRLHPAIIPVVWIYEGESLRGERGSIYSACSKHRPTWPLAAYHDGGRFIPHTPGGYDNFRPWVELCIQNQCPAIGSSRWGDGGYENHRDLSWHLVAAFGEFAWSGQETQEASLSQRFQKTFYGEEIPGLLPLTDGTTPATSLTPDYWHFHRINIDTIKRWSEEDPTIADRAQADLQRLQNSLKAVRSSHSLCRRESTHLLHWESAIARSISVARRILFCHEIRHTAPHQLSADQREKAKAIIAELETTRTLYRESWLQNNRRENISVSLKVFDKQIAEYSSLLTAQPIPPQALARFACLDLSDHFNQPVTHTRSFMPIGLAVLNDVPFHFAGLKQSHIQLESRQVLTLPLDGKPIDDIHLIATAPVPADRKPVPALRLELLRNGQTVFMEDLLAIRHLADSHDVYRRSNTWGGGGYALADPIRVSIAYTVNRSSLMHLHRFTFVGEIQADTLRLTELGNLETPPRIMAITMENPHA